MNKGSTVRWNTPQGETTGKTVEKKTSEFTLAGQKFNASKEEPYWIVESELRQEGGAQGVQPHREVTKT